MAEMGSEQISGNRDKGMRGSREAARSVIGISGKLL
jgi:hypothetical protein